MYDKSTNNAINDFIKEVINNIVEIKDSIFRELTAKTLAQIVNINEENILHTINNKITKSRRPIIKNDKTSSSQITIDSKTTLIEDDLIRLCLIDDVEIKQIIFENYM